MSGQRPWLTITILPPEKRLPWWGYVLVGFAVVAWVLAFLALGGVLL